MNSTIIYWVGIFAIGLAVSIVNSLIDYVFGIPMNSAADWIGYLIMLIPSCYFFAQWRTRVENRY